LNEDTLLFEDHARNDFVWCYMLIHHNHGVTAEGRH